MIEEHTVIVKDMNTDLFIESHNKVYYTCYCTWINSEHRLSDTTIVRRSNNILPCIYTHTTCRWR